MDAALGEVGNHLGWGAYGTIVLAAVIGAISQGTVGFGAAMILAPTLALVAPDALPSSMIIAAMPLVALMATRDHEAVDWSGASWMALGMLPGSIGGAWVVTTVAPGTVAVLAGAAVLVAVTVSLVAASLPMTRPTQVVAGLMSGLMGTATSISGPPMALLYQRSEGRVLRSTLAASFVFSTSVSVIVLAVAGNVRGWQILLAAAIVPALFLGLMLSRPLARLIDTGFLRPIVISSAALTGVMAIAGGI